MKTDWVQDRSELKKLYLSCIRNYNKDGLNRLFDNCKFGNNFNGEIHSFYGYIKWEIQFMYNAEDNRLKQLLDIVKNYNKNYIYLSVEDCELINQTYKTYN